MLPILSCRGLIKQYGQQRVVDGLNLHITPGQCFGLLGPNGAGKTTTLRLLLGLVTPDGGSITLNGFSIPQQAREARMRVGVVPQVDSLDPDFSVRENLLVYGRYFGLPQDTLVQRIPALLEFAGLVNKADAAITTLSGGMKRRLSLARALINNPDLVVLDEPTTGLDPQARHVVWQGLRQLVKQGKTLLLTTHFMEEAERICDRLIVMDQGRAIAEGSPRELIATHVEPMVAEIYGDGAEDWAKQHGPQHCQRLEVAGETLFCYARDAVKLAEHLQTRPDLRVLQRPANLEDVFLQLTGRELRE